MILLLPINNGWDGIVEVEVNDQMETIVTEAFNGAYVNCHSPYYNHCTWKASVRTGDRIRIHLYGTNSIQTFNDWAKTLPSKNASLFSYGVEFWDKNEQCWY